MEDFKKIKEAVRAAGEISILTSKNPSRDATGAALALFFSLKNIDKLVNLPTVSQIPQELDEPGQKNEKKTFLISLAKEISEIYYEKKDGRVNLYLKPKSGEIGPKDLSFKTVFDRPENDRQKEPTGKRSDLIIAVGLPSFQEIEEIIEESPGKYSLDIKIINLDNSKANQRYADFNLVKDFPSLSQVCAYFLKNTDADLVGKDAADSLIYGIKDPETLGIAPRDLPFLGWLMKNGGDPNLMLDEKLQTPSAGHRLLAQALQKIEAFDQDLYSCLLTKEDFKAAQASSKDIGFAIEELKARFKAPSCLILWESGSSLGRKKIIGVFYSDKEQTVKKLGQLFNGQVKGNGVLFSAKASDLKSAQKEILDLVKN
ncbi:MAG: hypothetical protein WC397_02070 [Candidatus Paceibacterota bacterium]|jgi:nanoRNase/pAp phosphatase (c-di-AMP/oligoRNAs hydrolase)